MIMLKTKSGLYYGNVASGISEIILYLGQQVSRFPWVAIRCIDSDCASPQILEVLHRFGIEAYHKANSIFTSGEQLYLAAQKRLFSGFDELWLWHQEPRKWQFPPEMGLTSDGINLNEGLPNDVENALRQLGCVLALGDGCGLNYVTTDRSLANYIEGVGVLDSKAENGIDGHIERNKVD
jgi:hypothetical protein